MKKVVSLIVAVAVFATLLLPGVGLFAPTTVVEASSAAAPAPNAFQMKIGEDGTVSNGVASDIYKLTGTATASATKTDAATGNKYVSFTEAEGTFYEISMRNDAQKGLFWDYYFHNQGNARNLSFTWELMVRLPKMPSGDVCFLGYYSSEGEGGFGLRADADKGTFVIGNNVGSGFQYCSSYAEFEFDMVANEWYHLVLTYDHNSKIANAYVNGQGVTPDGVVIDDIVLTHGLWHVRGFGLGTTSGFGQLNAVPVSNDVAVYNLSTYGITADQAYTLYLDALKPWTTVRKPNAFQLNIANDGTVTNGVDTNIYQLSGSSALPQVLADEITGNKYLSFDKNDDAYLEFSMRNTEAGNVGFFWSHYFNWEEHYYDREPKTDVSFTWEFSLRFPQMPATGATFDNVFGYFAGNGGIGFQANSTQGQFIVANGYTTSLEKGTENFTIPFDMVANEWYHCILTYNYATKLMSVYVNGELIDTITIEELIATNYTRSSRGFGIGSAPEYINLGAVPYNNHLSAFNFSTYGVGEVEAIMMYEQATKAWNEYAAIERAAPELNDSITLHCGAAISSLLEGEAKMVFNFKGEDIEVLGTKQGAQYTFSLPGILPQDMGETIHASLYVGDTLVDEVREYSLKTYCMNMLAKTTDSDTALRALLVALLNYGASAQTYFGSDVTELVNSSLTDIQKAYLPTYDMQDAEPVDQLVSGTLNENYVWKSVTLNLMDRIAYRIRFAASDIENTYIKVGDVIYTNEDFVSAGKDEWFVYTFGIAANDYDKVITVNFVDAQGALIADTQTVSYSVNTYVHYIANNTESGVKPIVQAIYDYGRAAETYVNIGA